MRKLVIVVVVLVGLLVVGDVVARGMVESRLATAVDEHEGVSGAEVDIVGFPFLTQVLGNEFSEVAVSFPAMTASTVAGSLQVDDVELTFYDVATSESYSQGVADRVVGTGTVPYSSFDAAGPLEVSYGGESDDGTGLVRLSVPGIDAGILLAPSVYDDRSLRLTPDGTSLRLPGLVQSLVSTPLRLDGLPSKVRIDSMEATEEGIEVGLLASTVSFTR